MSSIELDSNLNGGSPLVYTPGPDGTAASGTSSGGGLLGTLNPFGLLQPRARIYIDGVAEPIVVALWGEPTKNYLPTAGAILAGLVGGVALYTGAKSLAKGALFTAVGMLALGYFVNSQPAASSTPATP